MTASKQASKLVVVVVVGRRRCCSLFVCSGFCFRDAFRMYKVSACTCVAIDCIEYADERLNTVAVCACMRARM